MQQRLTLLLMVFLLAAAALTVTTHVTVAQRAESLREVSERIEPAREHLNSVVNALAHPEGGAEDMTAAMGRVRAQLGDDPAFAQRLSSLESAIEAMAADEADAAVPLAEAEALRAELLVEQNLARAEARQAETRLVALGWTVLVIAVGLVTAAAWCLKRWIMAPLAMISRAVDRVREGDLHHPIPPAGARELTGLAQDVEGMRARIVGLLDTSQRATQALEHQGVAVVSLRAELEPSVDELPEAAQFAATLHPAEGVLAGDWYDCVNLGDGRIGLAIVDVSGHGPEAGIFALRAKHLLLAALGDGKEPGAALTWLAAHIGETGERFLSAFVADIDTASGQCRWANAGHPAGMIVRDSAVERLRTTGPILGPLAGEWETLRTFLPVGATLVAYTDGLVEARAGDEQFGYSRVSELVRAHAGASPDEVVQRCVERVRNFTGGRVDDDITVVALALTEVPAPTLVSDSGSASGAAGGASGRGVVVRGGVEPPTFRFSGGRSTN